MCVSVCFRFREVSPQQPKIADRIILQDQFKKFKSINFVQIKLNIVILLLAGIPKPEANELTSEINGKIWNSNLWLLLEQVYISNGLQFKRYVESSEGFLLKPVLMSIANFYWRKKINFHSWSKINLMTPMKCWWIFLLIYKTFVCVEYSLNSF